MSQCVGTVTTEVLLQRKLVMLQVVYDDISTSAWGLVRRQQKQGRQHRNGNLKTVGGTVMNKAAKDVANGILSKKYKPIRALIRHSVHLNEQQT